MNTLASNTGRGRPTGTGRSTPALGKGESKTQTTLNNAERARQALTLRAGRIGYQEIADRLGYASRGGAFNAVKRELAKVPREAARELLNLELDSLDMLERKMMAKALSGNMGAVDRVLRIKELRGKYTKVFDTPVDSGVEEVRDVLKAWRAQLADDDAADVADEAVDDETEAGAA